MTLVIAFKFSYNHKVFDPRWFARCSSIFFRLANAWWCLFVIVERYHYCPFMKEEKKTQTYEKP